MQIRNRRRRRPRQHIADGPLLEHCPVAKGAENETFFVASLIAVSADSRHDAGSRIGSGRHGVLRGHSLISCLLSGFGAMTAGWSKMCVGTSPSPPNSNSVQS